MMLITSPCSYYVLFSLILTVRSNISDYYYANNIPPNCGENEYFNAITLNCFACDRSKFLKPTIDSKCQLKKS